MSNRIKKYGLVGFMILLINCNENNVEVQYSDGKDIFYNHCVSCHLVRGSIEVDTSLKMSSISLQRMSSLKPSFAKIKSQLKDSSYHNAIRSKISEKEIESIQYFILHSPDPKP
jgi:cytochrome c553